MDTIMDTIMDNAMDNATLKVVEIFYSIDGECPEAGIPTVFVRLAGCNLNCMYSENGCDTPYLNEYTDYTIKAIVSEIKRLSGECRHITLTGGEPLLQHDSMALRRKLFEEGYRVNIETNGTKSTIERYPNELFIVDYKAKCSKMTKHMKEDAYYKLKGRDCIKIVVGTEDLPLIPSYISTIDSFIEDSQSKSSEQLPFIYLSPCYSSCKVTDLVEIIKELTKKGCKYRVALNLQLHKIIWNADKRGV